MDPDGVSTTFGYDGSLRLLTLTNRRGKTTTLYYNSQSGKLDSIQVNRPGFSRDSIPSEEWSHVQPTRYSPELLERAVRLLGEVPRP